MREKRPLAGRGSLTLSVAANPVKMSFHGSLRCGEESTELAGAGIQTHLDSNPGFRQDPRSCPPRERIGDRGPAGKPPSEVHRIREIKSWHRDGRVADE